MKKTVPLTLIVLLVTQSFNVYPQNFENEDQISNLEKNDQTDYGKEIFTQRADFNLTRFDSAAIFREAKFKDGAEFMETNFLDTADFFNCYFNNADFFNACFFQNANFRKSDFVTAANFSKAKFKSTVNFSYSRFDSLVVTSFVESKFNSLVNFSNAKFLNQVDFSEAVFGGETDFTESTFDSVAVFNKADFSGETDFMGAILPNKLDLSYVTHISEEIDLTSATTNKKYGLCYINLTGADIDRIKFRYNRFKLWFPPKDTTIDFELKSNVYEVLLKKQQDEGFTQSYEKLDREYKEFKYTGKKGNRLELFWGQVQNWVDKNWWGYGYNKELIILNSLIIYLLFSILNAFILKHLTTRVYEAEKINEYWKETKGNKITMFFRSIPFSLFYTAQIFFGFKFDVDKLNYKENLQGFKVFNLIYFLMVYLSGLVCFAYLANYVLTV